MRPFARLLNYSDATRLLAATLEEASRTDERLTLLYERRNQKAEEAADHAAT